MTVLTARAMTEGTARRDANALVEATERLGAQLSAARRLGQPGRLGGGASRPPRAGARAAGRGRPRAQLPVRGGRAAARGADQRPASRRWPIRVAESSVSSRDHLRRGRRRTRRPPAAPRRPCRARPGGPRGAHAAARPPARPPHRVRATSRACLSMTSSPRPSARGRLRTPRSDALEARPPDLPAGGRRVVVVDRPGAPQSELRVGHVGAPRRIDDFHVLSVLNALLGGLFNSRLNQLLREEQGYTYGVHTRVRHAARRGTVRRPVRRGDRGDGARHRGHPRGARAHPRGARRTETS